MKSVTEYPFSIASGGTYTLPAMGDYFRIQSSTGSISVTVEGAGTLPNLLSGQGIKNTPFSRLVLVNTSGALNTGKILIASEEFIDNRTFGVNDLSAGTINTLKQPYEQTGFYNSGTVLTANTAETIFSAASNINGAIVISMFSRNLPQNAGMDAYIAHTSAPVNINTGTLLGLAESNFIDSGGTNNAQFINIQTPQFLAAGQGLYFISNSNQNSGLGVIRSVRFRLL